MSRTPFIAAVAALAAASFAGSASAREAALAGGYVGQVHGSQSSFVAVVLGAEGRVNAYLSNGHRLAERFAGSTGNGTLSVASPGGYTLHLRLTRGRAVGTVISPAGASRAFSAVAVADPGGVRAILVGPAGRQTLGGWIVWDAGAKVGRVVPSPSTKIERHSP
jgi:hypothetical protein